MPAGGGAIDGQISNFMTGYGRSAGVPYDEYQTIGIDYSMKWFDPEAFGVSNLVPGPPGAGQVRLPQRRQALLRRDVAEG